ncbi:MAG: iron-containing alcohol dehydrogenase [Bacteroidales bacterium]|nr:iron-containing alcohol dehydrogenase [Bacteroidales bacterium]
MENFTIDNPVKIHFGKDIIKALPESIRKYGKRVLFLYGKESIKRSGLYDQVVNLLIDFEVYEYSGIKSNPIIEDVDAAAKLGREKSVDVILAVGGGSVIDSAKLIAAAIPVEHKAWEFMNGNQVPKKAIPIIDILTLAATGSETNMFAVIQNQETKEKIGWGSPLVFPKESFLDPQLTYTVSPEYTAFGIIDLVAHALEAYFGKGESPLADRVIYGIIDEAMDIGMATVNNPENYDLRARVMYAALLALNGTTSHGRAYADWGVHAIGHELSLLYDLPHGLTLAIAYPAWLRLQADRIPKRIIELGTALFGDKNVKDTIMGFENFFAELGSPLRLSQLGFGEKEKAEIVSQMKNNKLSGYHHKLNDDDYEKLVDLMM